jgi:hypothetical protein
MKARGSASLAKWQRDAVRRMAASREETLAFVAALSEAEMLRPRTIDRWSVKDVLGHLLACDEESARRFALIARGRGDRIKWFESMAYADRFNAQTVAATRRLGLATVFRRMARVRADLIERFKRLPVAALRDPAHAYPVTEWLPAPGWSHERDHLAEIKAWWRAERAAGAGSARRTARASRTGRRAMPASSGRR